MPVRFWPSTSCRSRPIRCCSRLLISATLAFQSLAVGDVGGHLEGAEVAAGLVEDRRAGQDHPDFRAVSAHGSGRRDCP